MREVAAPIYTRHVGARVRTPSREHPRLSPRAAPAVGVVVAAAAMLALPGAAGAQSQLALSAHAARDLALPGAPYIYGASLATYTGAAGVRIGGALGDVRETRVSTVGAAAGDTRLSLGAWAADVDVIVAPAQLPLVRTALGGLGPYAFVGLGMQGVRRTALAARESAPAWSYGGGLAQPLLGALFLEAEARYRVPIVNDGRQPPAGFTRAWEYRAGLALRFGGRHESSGGDSPPRGRRRAGRRGRDGDGEWDRAHDPR